MLHLALTISTLAGPFAGDRLPEVVCDGQYAKHLQGVASNGVDAIYWSFTDVVVKTNLQGQVLARVAGPTHHGDLCYANGRIYVAWSNQFNKPGAQSKVYCYDADTLDLQRIVPVPEVTYGAGGMDYADGHFFIIGGLPPGIEENHVHEYDGDLRYVRTHVLPSGYTNLGIQTACFHDDHWWFGCYTIGGAKGLLKATRDLRLVGLYDVSPAIGLIGWGPGRFAMAVHFGEKWHAKLVPLRADDHLGLVPDR